MSEQTKSINFAVYYRMTVHGDRRWSAHSRDYSPEWDGYQGIFNGCGETYAKARADAIGKAKRAFAAEFLQRETMG